MISFEELRASYKNLIEKIAKKYGASNIRVFGSVARGEQHEQSDLDLIVKFEKGRSFFELVSFEMELEELLKLDVQVLSEKGLNPHIKDIVLKEAKHL